MYKLIPYELFLKSIPLMEIQNVSLVSRGIKPSKQTKKGFAEAWIDMRGSKKILHTKNGFGNQLWNVRRNSFIKRHMAQVKKNHEPLFIGGIPSKRHLSLIAWGYSPSVSQLKKKL